MKKLLFTVALLFSFTPLFAARPVVVLTSGDKSVFNKEVTINVVIDDHNTIIDGRDQGAKEYYGSQGEQVYNEFVSDLDRAHESFVTYYNEKKGSLRSTMAQNAQQAQYTLQVDIESMNVGNAGGMAWGLTRRAGGALVNGKMRLIDNASQQVVCEFEFEKVKGLMAPVFRARVISAYRYLSDALIDAVK